MQLAYDTAFDTMLATVDRRDRLDTAIAAMAADSAYTPVVTRLGCLRGVSTLTAFALAVEIGDWQRLTGRSIGAYLGLVPCESSSGATRSQGPITKTGNGHARRLLVEAAWHHRPPYRPGAALRRRWDQASPRRTGPRAAGQPAAARPLAGIRRTPQARHRRQRRHRPRAGRLVLVAGRARGLSPAVRSPFRTCPILVAAGPASRSVLLAALRGLHLDPGAATTTTAARTAEWDENVRPIRSVVTAASGSDPRDHYE